MIETFFAPIVTIGWILMMLFISFVIIAAIVLMPIWLFSHMQALWDYLLRKRS